MHPLGRADGTEDDDTGWNRFGFPACLFVV
jgi:hypothetical protein